MTDYLEQLFQPPEALTKAAAALDELIPLRRTAAKRETARKAPSEDHRDGGPGTLPDDLGADWNLSGGGGIFRQEEALALPLLRAVAAADSAAPVAAGIQSGRELAPSGGTAAQSPSAAAASMEVRAVDLAFQRDGRRYDNGFSLY